MTRRLVQIWSWLAVILPALIGLGLLFYADQMIPAGAKVSDLAHSTGLRNLALSVTILIALLTQPKRVVAFLLIARGLTDVFDSLSTIVGSGQVTGQGIAPMVGAILTFACAYYWLREDKK